MITVCAGLMTILPHSILSPLLPLCLCLDSVRCWQDFSICQIDYHRATLESFIIVFVSGQRAPVSILRIDYHRATLE